MEIVCLGQSPDLFMKQKIYILELEGKYMKSVYSNINNYPDITLNTELGHMHIIDYIDII